MKKYFVLDTNVLLHDVNSLFAFGDNDIVIPMVAIEELDRFKKDLNEIGRNARQVSRLLDKLRAQGPLYKGILPSELIFNKADNQILSVAMELKETGDRPVCLVTKDTNLRIKADSLGLTAKDYESDKVEISELYQGFRTFQVSKDIIDSYYADASLKPPANDLHPHEGVILVEEGNPKHTALARFDKDKGILVPLNIPKDGVWGIHPKNVEQRFAMSLLLDDSVKLVSLAGKAGTGKTLLAIAAGLKKTADEEVFIRLLVSRPIFPLGKDIGYLPGELEEKLTPWMQPIFDNLELIFGGERKHKGKQHGYRELMTQGILQIEPLTYIRGRSIPNQYMIVDEAQNLTPHEIKTIITRAGDNTKIVLTGDPYQIDNPYIDSSSNGLSYVAERLKNETITGHMTLSKGERSELAETAANLL
ncbi:MAG: PhoH family protein [Deltaproteobacteria bacterium]|nr:PhoH family protein [Deltaproteobacteria bacterium]